ncbi:hypothetical protein AX16_010240 [Volvariella volvacea WC 439]|nr:hypothetical protein AX16_010240 [Volvariella volvacea WC 439]
MSEPFIALTYTLFPFINAIVNDPIKVHTTTPRNKLITIMPIPTRLSQVSNVTRSTKGIPARPQKASSTTSRKAKPAPAVVSTIDGCTRRSSTHRVKLDLAPWAPADFTSHMEAMHYPEYLLTEDALHFVQGILSQRPKGIRDFQLWRESIAAQTEEGDKYQLKYNLPALAVLWHRLADQSEQREPEAALRAALDTQGYIAFQQRPGADQRWRSEPLLTLPGSPEGLDCVRADAIVTANVPSDLARLIKVGPAGSWGSTKAVQTEHPSVVVFVVQMEKDSVEDDQALRQLQVSFYSAHLHRERLAMKSGPIFGATMAGTNVRLYVSHMVEKELTVQPILDDYRLCNFNDYLSLYFDLCRISEYQSRWLEDENQRWRGGRKIQGEKISTIAARENLYSGLKRGAVRDEDDSY